MSQVSSSSHFVRHHAKPCTIQRTGIAAGSPVPIDLMKQLIEKLNLTELTVAYGMSAFLFFPSVACAAPGKL